MNECRRRRRRRTYVGSGYRVAALPSLPPPPTP